MCELFINRIDWAIFRVRSRKTGNHSKTNIQNYQNKMFEGNHNVNGTSTSYCFSN